MPTAVVYLTAVMLFVGVAPLPYGYYTLLRIVVTGVFVWAAIVSYGRHDRWLPWVYGLLAILFNPLLPVHLPKEVWMPIDIVAALFLLFTKRRIQASSDVHG